MPQGQGLVKPEPAPSGTSGQGPVPCRYAARPVPV